MSTFEKEAVNQLRNIGTCITVNVTHEWTDGSVSQYKECHGFAAISLAEEVLEAKVVRNVFETSQGKGPCDGLEGIMK